MPERNLYRASEAAAELGISDGVFRAWLAKQGLASKGRLLFTNDILQSLKAKHAILERMRQVKRESRNQPVKEKAMVDQHYVLQAMGRMDIVTKADQIAFPGVYFLIHKDTVIYVGKSVDVLRRINQHRRDKVFQRWSVIRCERHELNALESEYIRALRPRYNVNGRSG